MARSEAAELQTKYQDSVEPTQSSFLLCTTVCSWRFLASILRPFVAVALPLAGKKKRQTFPLKVFMQILHEITSVRIRDSPERLFPVNNSSFQF